MGAVLLLLLCVPFAPLLLAICAAIRLVRRLIAAKRSR